MDLRSANVHLVARDFSTGEQPGYRGRERGDGMDGLDFLEPLPFPELPPTLPSHPRLRFGRFHSPGRHGGVDYHDVLNLGGNRFAVVMADLSGPGAPAAAAMIRTVVRSHAGRHDDAGSLIHRIGAHLRYLWNGALLATGICAVVDTRRRTVRIACAGHQAPLLVREGTAVMPLLVHSTTALRHIELIVTSEYDLRSGDRLLFYSDGVTDCENAVGALYNVERLRATLEETRDFPATLAVAHLANDIERFAGGHEPDDDQTLLMVGIN